MKVEPPSSRSPLPRDPEYWNVLAERILEDARIPLSVYAARRDDWCGVLSREAPWLMALSASLVLLLWIALPAPTSSSERSFMERAVAPRETAGTLLGGSAPPSVEELMLAFPPALESEAP